MDDVLIWAARRARLRFIALAAIAAAGCLQAPPGSSGPPDAPPAGDDGGVSAATCNEVFGDATDYKLCLAEADSCRFYTRFLDGVDFTCAAVCAEFGVVCLDGFADTDMDDKCEVDQREGCESEHEDQICVCPLP